MKYYYTDKEFKELCKDIDILHDTREQENSHILDWFDKKGIQHSTRALEYGDYCFRISPKSSDRHANAWFTDEIFIERKNSLDELAGNLKEQRLFREIKEAQRVKHKYLIIENTTGWHDILMHNYQSAYDHKAYYNTLQSLQQRYGILIIFVPTEYVGCLMGQLIYSIAKTALKAHVKT